VDREEEELESSVEGDEDVYEIPGLFEEPLVYVPSRTQEQINADYAAMLERVRNGQL
jgi:hypothetical protein